VEVKSLYKIILTALGTIFVSLGIVGIFLPILPTTPFLLLGAACYIRGSKKFYNWIINNKYLGSYIKNYRENRSIPKKTKILAVTLLWFSIISSVVFFIPQFIVKAVLLLVAAGVTVHILALKTIDN
jgi:uncharacterized membrane protein YbaN (DUF454 family)